MKTILVTGATGLLGKSVVDCLLDKKINVVSAIRSSKQCDYIIHKGETTVLNEDLFEGRVSGVDVVINCVFARSNKAELLAGALDFTTKLIDGLRKAGVESVINISSQGVYKRMPVGQLSKEDSPIEPVDMYSLSKYAAEQMFLVSGIRHVTNVRLSSLMMKQRFLYLFVKNAKEEGVIHLDSPGVYASIMDVGDAADALVALANIDTSQWSDVYNLGIGAQYSLAEYAEEVKSVGSRLGYKIDIILNDKGNSSTAGTDISLLMADTGWRPSVTNTMMIERLFNTI